MTIVYFDASALVKLTVDEPGSEIAAQLWDGADAVVTTTISFAEVRAALAAAERDQRLSPSEHRTGKDEWDHYWQDLRTVAVTTAIAEHAGKLAEQYALRGYDAVHLACALALDGPCVVLAGWD